MNPTLTRATPTDDVRWFDLDQVLPGGFRFPARMTVVRVERQLALISPIPIDDTLARELATLGEVTVLVAPNLLHHLYLGAAAARYPRATVLAPARLREKRPDLRIDRDLAHGWPAPFDAAVEALRFEGAPDLDETVFFHRPSGTLVVTDLVFHIRRPRGLVAHLVLAVVGCHGRLAQSRAVRFLLVKDRVAAAASAAALCARPLQRLVMAHGEVVEQDAQAALAGALAWLSPTTKAIASG